MSIAKDEASAKSVLDDAIARFNEINSYSPATSQDNAVLMTKLELKIALVKELEDIAGSLRLLAAKQNSQDLTSAYSKFTNDMGESK